MIKKLSEIYAENSKQNKTIDVKKYKVWRVQFLVVKAIDDQISL